MRLIILCASSQAGCKRTCIRVERESDMISTCVLYIRTMSLGRSITDAQFLL